MSDRKFTDDEVIKAFDILDKFELFGGQRAGRELWFNKPTDIQNKDIGEFLRDLDFLKQFINRQKAEIERLKNSGIRANSVEDWLAHCNELRAKAIKEFAERLKEKERKMLDYDEAGFSCMASVIYTETIDNLVKEMTEGGEPRKDVGK